MKKLKELDMYAAAKLSGPMSRMRRNKPKVSGNIFISDYLFQVLEDNPDDMRTVMAVMSEQDPATYQLNAVETFNNIDDLVLDDDFIGFFGLYRRPEKDSSTSASENTEDHPISDVSPGIVQNGINEN